MIRQYGYSRTSWDKYTRQAQRIKRQLVAAKIHNWRMSVKWGMLRTSKMRSRVLEDLGGERALLKWELRALEITRRAITPLPAKPEPSGNTRTNAKTDTSTGRKIRSVKTDRLGLFRLAPLPRRMQESPKWPRFQGYRWEIKAKAETRTQARAALPVNLDAVFGDCQIDDAGNLTCDFEPDIKDIKPIPLLPKELRGEGINPQPDLDDMFDAVMAEKQATRTEPLRLEYHPVDKMTSLDMTVTKPDVIVYDGPINPPP